MSWLVRPVRQADLPSIADIVNHYIRGGAIHFGERPESADDWRGRWWALKDDYAWLVAEQAGLIGGIAYARPWNSRTAYAWTAETTIYLRPEHVGQGLGRVLYGRLLELLDAQGYRTLVAGITIPNESSVRLHEALGFAYVGALRQVGFKQAAWHDVGLWQRHASSGSSAPGAVRRVADV